jgi:hypothetical protein
MELKPRALASFDEWHDKVLGRIGDVLNSSETVPKAAQRGHDHHCHLRIAGKPVPEKNPGTGSHP